MPPASSTSQRIAVEVPASNRQLPPPGCLKFLDSKQRSRNHLLKQNNLDPIFLAASSKIPSPPWSAFNHFAARQSSWRFLLQAPNTNTTTTDAVASATFTSNTHTHPFLLHATALHEAAVCLYRATHAYGYGTAPYASPLAIRHLGRGIKIAYHVGVGLGSLSPFPGPLPPEQEQGDFYDPDESSRVRGNTHPDSRPPSK
ncbi:hypothetical protein CPLU01_08320 [Colletotrichum plurivorum]|uniref:Uncharacterized protein n=1 Tax=Colletotrichum plurivorum TaxID=2175906 RepID=A0A8H6ND00_9PEZI|nr:hypothetical protein CPLU01_08320 [Colletotrichum plurivorum]